MEPKKLIAAEMDTPFSPTLLEAEKLFLGFATAELQEARNLSGKDQRLHKLLKLQMLCNLSAELSNPSQHKSLLEHLAQQAIKITHSTFSQIFTWEPEGSFICQASCHSPSTGGETTTPYEAPVASWLHYLQAIQQKKPVILKQAEHHLSEDECYAMGLGAVEELWMLPLWAGSEKIGLFILGSNARSNEQKYDRLGQMLSLADQAIIGIQRKRIQVTLEKSFVEIVLALAGNMGPPSRKCNQHEHQTSILAGTLGSAFGFSQAEIQSLQWAGLLHDIGKIQISEELLQKPGPLTPEEWQIMREHPVYGAQLLQSISLFREVVPIIQHHHEKYDGSGYPSGLSGEDIPLGARILAVADAYSVIVEGRVYCQRRSQKEALQELRRCSGTHFDPHVVKKFVELAQIGLIN